MTSEIQNKAYLGLMIELYRKGKVVFSMFDFLEDIIVKAPYYLKGWQKHNTPSAAKLFFVDENSPLLSNKKSNLFHCLVARLLFAA